MTLAMYFSPLKAVKKKWINNSFKIYFAVQLDNLSFNHSVNLYSFFPYHRWSIFFLFEYYFILNFWAVSCWLKYNEDKRSSYQLYGYTCKKLSTKWHRRVYWEDNKAESCLFIHLQHHFYQTLWKLFDAANCGKRSH